jgi:hypothetical protein
MPGLEAPLMAVLFLDVGSAARLATASKKGTSDHVPTPGALTKYGRGREVHAWQTLPGAVVKTLPLR